MACRNMAVWSFAVGAADTRCSWRSAASVGDFARGVWEGTWRIPRCTWLFLLPGDFTPLTETAFPGAATSTLEVPNEVTIQAVTPGTVTLENGSSGGPEFLGSGGLERLGVPPNPL